MIKFIEKLTLVYCFFAALTVTGQISAPAQNSSLDAAAARRYFLEAKTLCEKDKGRLWGQSLCGPLLLVNAQTREVFANQADKEGVL